MTTNDLFDPWEDALSPEEEVTAIARAAVLVSGLVLLAYLLQLGVSFLAGRETSAGAVLGDLISLGLSGLLLWRVWARMALWAALLAGVFFAAEFAAQLWSFFQGLPTGGLLIMFATLAAAAVVSSFGCWRLAGLRDGEL
jgi:hypothetical protein